MADRPDDAFLRKVGGPRLVSRQIDELIGMARMMAADGTITVAEVEFLEKWLAANLDIADQPLIRTLYQRIREILSDGVVDADEQRDLMATLNSFADRTFALGEPLKATTLPLSDPAPVLAFEGRRYCFTGTFMFGQRKLCEQTVVARGAVCGSLTQKTDFLVIGIYATASWKHSAFGNKILQAAEWRERGLPIAIVSEEHWSTALRSAEH